MENKTKKPNNYDTKNFFKKFTAAANGFFVALKEEISLLIHIILGIIILILGILLHNYISYVEWIILVLIIGLAISSELVNTANEQIINIIKFEYNQGAKKVKDISAAATLVISVFGLIICLMIFIPAIIHYAHSVEGK